MSDKKSLADTLFGAIPSVLISLFTALVVFSGTFAALKTTVDAQGEQIKNLAPKSDIEQIEHLRERSTDKILNKIDGVDKKVDNIYLLLIKEK